MVFWCSCLHSLCQYVTLGEAMSLDDYAGLRHVPFHVFAGLLEPLLLSRVDEIFFHSPKPRRSPPFARPSSDGRICRLPPRVTCTCYSISLPCAPRLCPI
jgi:hypothetical protein